MSVAILDTSSLIALVRAEREREIPRGDTSTYWKRHGEIDSAVEALVLYNHLYLDGPSLNRNAEQLPELEEYGKICSLLGLEEGFEDKVYRAVLSNYVSQIEIKNPGYINLFRMHTEKWMADEVGARSYYPSAGWRDIERELNGEAAAVAHALRKAFGEYLPYSGAACALLLRTFYYYELQQQNWVNLILHPLKGAFVEKGPRFGAHILGMFDQSVRAAFEERKQKWLGRSDLSISIPLLSSFVLNQCHSWADLRKVILDVRNSNEAIQFRDGFNTLLSALQAPDNQVVDEIILALDTAAETWSKKLSIEGSTRTVSVTVPLIGVSTAVSVPDPKLRKSPSDKLLVFIHALLRGA